MNINGASVGISPASSSNVSVTFVRDYSNANFQLLTTNPIYKPYLTVNNAAGVGLTGYSLIETLNLNTNISPNFGAARSVAFDFRPYYSSNDYQQNPGKVRFQYVPSVILFNQRTGQTVRIQADRLPLYSATVAAATTSYVPLSLAIQGCVPFYFDSSDVIEVCNINPNSEQFGKLSLTFFNFDNTAWMKTTIDQLVTAD